MDEPYKQEYPRIMVQFSNHQLRHLKEVFDRLWGIEPAAARAILGTPIIEQIYHYKRHLDYPDVSPEWLFSFTGSPQGSSYWYSIMREWDSIYDAPRT